MYVNLRTLTIAISVTFLVILMAYLRLDDRIAQLEHIVYQQYPSYQEAP